jgi:hypothetical protein
VWCSCVDGTCQPKLQDCKLLGDKISGVRMRCTTDCLLMQTVLSLCHAVSASP